MNKLYVTLDHKNLDTSSLTKKEYEFLKKVMKFYKKKPHWNVFSNYWLREGQKIWGGIPKREVIKKPLFLICQDLEVRLGIEQGRTRLPDYRDKLAELIDKKYKSHYQLCKEAHIAQDTLSRILNKRREPSLRLLQAILDVLGYEITFQKKHL